MGLFHMHTWMDCEPRHTGEYRDTAKGRLWFTYLDYICSGCGEMKNRYAYLPREDKD